MPAYYRGHPIAVDRQVIGRPKPIDVRLLQSIPPGQLAGYAGKAADQASYAEPADQASPARRRLAPSVVMAGWLAVGLIAGAAIVGAMHSSRTANATGAGAAAVGNAAGPGAGAPGAGAPPGVGGPGFGGGGFDGEQHLFGTLTAVGASTVTVQTAGGATSTYQIDGTTELVKDGQQVSSLSAMHVGDRVVVHAYPLNGTTHVERIIDGPRPGRDNGSGAGTTT